MSHWIDEAYIEACREVDALFPGTPPIAPAAEAIMKTGMDAIEKQAERAETLRQRSDTLVRLGVTASRRPGTSGCTMARSFREPCFDVLVCCE